MSGTRVVVARLDHGSANAIGPSLLSDLGRFLDEAESSEQPLVVTGTGRFFSAGLDLAGLPEDRDEMGAFVDAFDALLLRLFMLPCPTVAAVNGHAVAGGAILAAATDVRIAAEGEYRVGVSEVQLGVIFPAVAFEILRATIPLPHTSEVLLRGRLTGPPEAVAHGFFHELTSADTLLEGAVARAEELGQLPREAYAHTKHELRSDFATRAEEQRATKREQFLDTWFSEESRARREAILQRSSRSG